jgi:hypothetical protein
MLGLISRVGMNSQLADTEIRSSALQDWLNAKAWSARLQSLTISKRSE